MWKQLIYTILLTGFLCASEFAHSIEMCTNHPLVGDVQGTWESTLQTSALERQTYRCANTKPIMLHFIAAGHNEELCREVPVWRLSESAAFFFVAGMTIDADGAPNAYNPEDTGLDDLANAGNTTHWDGIVTDRDGHPLIQQDSDPFPGYYVSCTTLADESKQLADPSRYVDASKIPYVVLPQDVADRGGVRLGDFAFVMNLRNGRSSFAIYADVGTLGEGSIALAQALGIRSDARAGGTSDGVLYVLFPDSGNQRPRTVTEIETEGERLLYLWGGIKTLSSCPDDEEHLFSDATTVLCPPRTPATLTM